MQDCRLAGRCGPQDRVPRSHRPALARQWGPVRGGTAYCVALAKFGTAADADLLAAYLDRYLLRPELDYDQPTVLGTLLYLDGVLGSDSASRFIAPGGPWDRWLEVRVAAALDPYDCRQGIEQLCAFATETAETLGPRIQGRRSS
ncbi:DUF6000 family protein [Streptomyces sp. NPDC006487]|uniref:DUF6000 family protein n=1 Tax=Streptomyces sp. NPDC006487 TaxID=3364748 RepID=UPI0036AB7796